VGTHDTRTPPLTAHRGLHLADASLASSFVLASAAEGLVRYHDQPVQLAINLPGASVWAVLYLRRTRPLLMLAVVAVSGTLGSLFQAWLVPDALTNSDVAIVALLVATYSLGAHGSRRQLVLGAPLPVLLILAVDLLQPSDQPLASAVPFAVFFVVIAPVVGGRLVRARAALVARLRAQAAELATHRREHFAAELARDRLAISERFHAELVRGVRDLGRLVQRVRAEDLTQAAEVRDEAGVGEIELAARALLARTRQVVVSLTDPPAPRVTPDDVVPVRGPGAWRARVRADAQPWTALAAAALAAGLVVELPSLPRQVPLPVAVLACVVLALPLAVVWASPLLLTVVLWVGVALFDTYVATLATSTAAIGLFFAVPFAVAALATRRPAVAGFVVCGVGATLVFGGDDLGGALALSAVSWLAGLVLREWSDLADQLRDNARLLAEQRAAATQGAVMRERVRMATDLHDAVGHSLTIVALQAGAARRLWTADPARAATALRTINDVIGSGLAELESGWGLDGTSGPLDQPAAHVVGRASFTALLDGARKAGLPLETQLDDVGPGVGAEPSLVLYRVLQESLTNILRHAPGSTATVSLHPVGTAVELTVTNTAGQERRTTGVADGSGRGLAGMRARVAACGGRLDWSRAADGGFVVRAEVPYAQVRT
jgi:signal transduction histidine kinase